MTATLDRATAPQQPSRSPAAPRPSTPQPAHVDPRVVLGLIAAGAVAVLGLWWHDTAPLRPVTEGLGDWLTNAGRITGLLAGYGVVVLLALMARIPALERGVGTDRLARWHSSGGRYTVCLVVAHGLLVTWGYAVQAHVGVVPQATSLLTSYPDVLAATVAGLLLVGVGIVSMRAARRRLRYETWYYLHFYTYLAVALAFSHQFATGADFMTNRAARVAWAGLYVTVGALLLWHRVLTPVQQAFRHRLRVVGARRESPDAVSVYVGGRHLQELHAQPGQFFRWRFLTRDLWWASNPYSLSAPVSPGLMRITVKDLGDHSHALAGLRPGTRVVAEGPYGAFTAQRRVRTKTLLIAGGIGITPCRALFETLPARPGDLTLVYRVSEPEDVVLRDELEAVAAARGARLYVVVGTRSRFGADPLSKAALQANIPELRDHDVFVCGPGEMTRDTAASLRAAGVPTRQIHHESFEL